MPGVWHTTASHVINHAIEPPPPLQALLLRYVKTNQSQIKQFKSWLPHDNSCPDAPALSLKLKMIVDSEHECPSASPASPDSP
mmetsp:Transcript_3652/g.6777  ORF Transcript_3652/g.6777 Transcript_3652/m.6777 type:complete len:83 (+) Transcript_3652:53-301(+)